MACSAALLPLATRLADRQCHPHGDTKWSGLHQIKSCHAPGLPSEAPCLLLQSDALEFAQLPCLAKEVLLC